MAINQPSPSNIPASHSSLRIGDSLGKGDIKATFFNNFLNLRSFIIAQPRPELFSNFYCPRSHLSATKKGLVIFFASLCVYPNIVDPEGFCKKSDDIFVGHCYLQSWG